MGFGSTVLVMVVVVMVEGNPQIAPQPFSYHGWKVLELRLLEATPGSPRIDLTKLDDGASVNVLGQNRQTGVAEVAVSPSALPTFTAHLSERSVPFSTIVEDLGRKIQAFEPHLRAEPLAPGSLTLDRYMKYQEIESYLQSLPGKHGTKVTVKEAGRSVEGKPIHLVTITNDVANANTHRKPIIFIDGGIHAREWVSPAAVMGVIDNLVQTPSLTEGIEWRIIPLVNPDGYTATWESNRLWRKNRAKPSHDSSCVGVDLNRNFGYRWGGEGTSPYECSNVYKGPSPFSEPEAKAVRDAVWPDRARTEAYVTYHSYGQMILHPWGYSAVDIPSNNYELERVGKGMAKAIKRTKEGVKYQVGSAAGVLYAAAGGSDDWAAGEAKIPLSFTIELRDKGSSGFILPASKIRATVADAWAAMKYLGEEVLRGKNLRGPGTFPLRQAGSADTEATQAESDFQAPVRGNQEPVGENEGLKTEEVVAGIENQEGYQIPVNRNQKPGIDHLTESDFRAPAEGNQKPASENERLKTEEVVAGIENQEGYQIPVTRNQKPSTDHQRGTQGSAETSEMEEDSGDASFESPTQKSSAISFISQIRDDSESHNGSPEARGSFQHAPGDSVLLRILRGDEEGSSEEGGRSESAE